MLRKARPIISRLAFYVNAAVFFCVLSGCSPTAKVARETPMVPVPYSISGGGSVVEFSGVTITPGEETVAADSLSSKPLQEWWRLFSNEELNALVDRGFARNADIRIATVRMAQANALFGKSIADGMPEVSASVAATSQRTGRGAEAVTQNDYTAGLQAGWRVDLWGEQASKEEFARQQLSRAVYARHDLVRNVAGGIVAKYFDYASLNDRLRVANELESVMSDTIPTIQKRLDAGDATLTELEQQKAVVFSLQATIPGLILQREDVLNALAALVGADPNQLRLSDSGLDTLHLPNAAGGMPSKLLLKRPDVRAAEALLLSANADLDAARARMFPTLDLSAQLGYSSLYLDNLFSPTSLLVNAMASLTASIFDGGRRSRDREISDAVREELVETYAKTIHQALREVEAALTAIRWTKKRVVAQELAADSARRAWEASRKIYMMGGIDHLSLLDTERNYYRYLDDFHRAKMEHMRGYVSLFQALGVGFGVIASGDSQRFTGVPETRSPTIRFVEEKDKDSSHSGLFWRVELIGLYHRDTIESLSRDLSRRFERNVAGKVLVAELAGKNDSDLNESWHRVFLTGFTSAVDAESFAAELSKDLQRTRVFSPDGDLVVPKQSASDVRQEATATSLIAGITAAPQEALPSILGSEKPLVEIAAIAIPAETSQTRLSAQIQQREGVRPELPKEERGQSPSAPAIDVELKAASALVAPATIVTQPEATNVVSATEQSVPEIRQRSVSPGVQGQAFAVQFGAFLSQTNATRSLAAWGERDYAPYVAEMLDTGGRRLYAIRTGVFKTRTEARSKARQIETKEGVRVAVVSAAVDVSGVPLTMELPGRP